MFGSTNRAANMFELVLFSKDKIKSKFGDAISRTLSRVPSYSILSGLCGKDSEALSFLEVDWFSDLLCNIEQEIKRIQKTDELLFKQKRIDEYEAIINKYISFNPNNKASDALSEYQAKTYKKNIKAREMYMLSERILARVDALLSTTKEEDLRLSCLNIEAFNLGMDVQKLALFNLAYAGKAPLLGSLRSNQKYEREQSLFVRKYIEAKKDPNFNEDKFLRDPSVHELLMYSLHSRGIQDEKELNRDWYLLLKDWLKNYKNFLNKIS